MIYYLLSYRENVSWYKEPTLSQLQGVIEDRLLLCLKNESNDKENSPFHDVSIAILVQENSSESETVNSRQGHKELSKLSSTIQVS